MEWGGDRGSDTHRWAEEQISSSDCPGTPHPPSPPPSLPLTWPEVKHASLSASSHLLHNYSLFGGVIITGICLPALKQPDRGFVFPPRACRFLCNVWVFFLFFSRTDTGSAVRLVF